MKKKEKKKIFELYSNNEQVSNLINKMKSSSKIYLKIISGLQVLGNFDGKTEVEIYDIVDTEKERKTRLWCSDNNDNLFIFYVLSNDKKDLLKIYKITNENTIEHDLTLAKKSDITVDNIEMTMSGKILDFKFGRLITDNKYFYSLFMSDNIVYHISGDFDKNLTADVNKKINELADIPKLSEFIKIFERILLENTCSFSKLKILAFKNGIKIGNIVIEDKELNKPKLLKRAK